MFVLSGSYGLGIWKQHVQKVEDLAREKQFTSITVPTGRTSIGFYEKLGYSHRDGGRENRGRWELCLGKEVINIGLAEGAKFMNRLDEKMKLVRVVGVN